MFRPLSEQALSKIGDLVVEVGAKVTEFDLEQFKQDLYEFSGDDAETLARHGITLKGRTDCVFIVKKSTSTVGRVVIENTGGNNIFVFGSSERHLEFAVHIRTQGSGCVVAFPGAGSAPVHIPSAYMRSDGQILFWGVGATSVASKIEIEGANKRVIVGDDAMFSSGVWIRNHDMHTLFDVESGAPFNLNHTDMIFEQHVWLGFEVFVLAAARIGYGTVVGARAFVKESLPSEVLAVGMPAKIIRNRVSWCRSHSGVMPSTITRLQRLRAL